MENPQVSPQNQADWLSSYKKNVTSQYGEDGIIEKIFAMLPETKRWCVEFGAWDGKYMSNVWRLIAEKGWSGVLIEASKNRHTDLCRTYHDHKNAICLNTFVNFDGPNTLDQILVRTPIPKNFDLLSIDIDGNDYHIWESLNIYRPTLILIEFNPSIPTDIEFVQPKDVKINQGNSLLSLCNLAKKKGYELIATTTCNAFFIQKTYYHFFGISDNNPAMIHKERTYQTQIFQLFDGTLILKGCTKLLWHNLEIKQERIQIVPKFFRTYPENFDRWQRWTVGFLKTLINLFSRKNS